MNDVRFLVEAGQVPANACPKTLQDIAAIVASIITVTPDKAYSTFYVGDVAPTSDKGPWFIQGDSYDDLRIWNAAQGKYISIRLPGFTPIGGAQFWPGSIASIPLVYGPNWCHADGRAVSRSVYATLFSRYGSYWGGGDGSTTFNIPTCKDIMLACASVDDAGVAKTTMADPLGAALLQSRGYVKHKHARNGSDASTGSGSGIPASGNSYSTTELDTASDTSTETDVKVLPPFLAMPFVIRLL